MSIIRPGFGSWQINNVHDPFSFQVWDRFNNYHVETAVPNETLGFVEPKSDWKETQDAHVLRLDLPGMKKEEVKVEVVDDRVLKISGERNVEREEKREKWHLVERNTGQFVRVFGLPETARVDKVKAAMKDGLLTVTVPKGGVKKARVRNVPIS
ncbi:HSP20-like chaperones superfamily protein [Actinidia rufa]|uniref:HSP20-like chaperones superfamily protein n=1 Tax=Actinidia rufa TaxID=165716 RepID=A0A7J0E7C1_9ERIC|nr:HSP20-like chaperones superfamily protein [Actinidia rufa]